MINFTEYRGDNLPKEEGEYLLKLKTVDEPEQTIFHEVGAWHSNMFNLVTDRYGNIPNKEIKILGYYLIALANERE